MCSFNAHLDISNFFVNTKIYNKRKRGKNKNKCIFSFFRGGY